MKGILTLTSTYLQKQSIEGQVAGMMIKWYARNEYTKTYGLRVRDIAMIPAGSGGSRSAPALARVRHSALEMMRQ